MVASGSVEGVVDGMSSLYSRLRLLWSGLSGSWLGGWRRFAWCCECVVLLLAKLMLFGSVLGGGCRGCRGQAIVSGGESSSVKRMLSSEAWLMLSYGAERREVWLRCASKSGCRW